MQMEAPIDVYSGATNLGGAATVANANLYDEALYGTAARDVPSLIMITESVMNKSRGVKDGQHGRD